VDAWLNGSNAYERNGLYGTYEVRRFDALVGYGWGEWCVIIGDISLIR